MGSGSLIKRFEIGLKDEKDPIMNSRGWKARGEEDE
jgi:hypothetical protein